MKRRFCWLFLTNMIEVSEISYGFLHLQICSFSLSSNDIVSTFANTFKNFEIGIAVTLLTVSIQIILKNITTLRNKAHFYTAL